MPDEPDEPDEPHKAHKPDEPDAVARGTGPTALEALVRPRPPTGNRRPEGVPVGRAVLVVVAAAAAGWFGWRLLARPASLEDTMPVAAAGSAATGSSTSGPSGTGASGTGPSTAVTDAATTSTGGPVTVHVAGAVATAGVVTVPAGSRVQDAVRAAGGFTPDAEPDRLNLAAPLVDGSRIAVPRRGEQPAVEVPTSVDGSPAGGASGSTPGGAAPAPVDLNTATAEQLDALPGVGPATAAAILDRRREVGRFESVDDLLEVRGIGEAKLDALRDLVRVG